MENRIDADFSALAGEFHNPEFDLEQAFDGYISISQALQDRKTHLKTEEVNFAENIFEVLMKQP